MKFILPFCIILSFFVTFFVTPVIIKYLVKINVVVKDVHKKLKPLVPRSGGIAVLIGMISALMAYVFVQTFFYKSTISSQVYLLAAIISMIIITIVGVFDDLLVRLKKGVYIGLEQWQKPLLTLPAAIPLMVVMAGTTIVCIPFFCPINIGIIYPLILIPLGVVGASNMVNLLEGLNGLGSGMGLIYTFMLGLYALVHGNDTAVIIAFTSFAALLAFYYYHKYPAKILAGDSLTYLLGAIIVSIAVLGNMEKAAIIISIPFFIEVILKARGGYKKETIGFLNKNGKLQSKYNKIYSLPHIWMRSGKYTEKQIVYFLMIFEFLCSLLIWFV